MCHDTPPLPHHWRFPGTRRSASGSPALGNNVHKRHRDAAFGCHQTLWLDLDPGEQLTQLGQAGRCRGVGPAAQEGQTGPNSNQFFRPGNRFVEDRGQKRGPLAIAPAFASVAARTSGGSGPSAAGARPPGKSRHKHSVQRSKGASRAGRNVGLQTETSVRSSARSRQ